MRIVDFRAEHLDLLEPPLGPATRALGPYHERSGPAWSGFDDRNLVGCMGAFIEDGEARCWAVFSVGWQRHFVLVSSRARRFLRETIKRPDILRITARVQACVPGADCWLEALGFRADGDIEGWLGTPLKFTRFVYDRA